jgi:hypothetical protein
MARAPQLSQVSPARQRLIRLCQSTNYGHIQELEIRDGEPMFPAPACIVSLDIKLDSEEWVRPAVTLPDFALSSEVVRLIALLDKMQDGKISKIEVRAGIPRRVTWERRVENAEVSK